MCGGWDGLGCAEHQEQLREWHNQALSLDYCQDYSFQRKTRLSGSSCGQQRSPGMTNTWVLWTPDSSVRSLAHTTYQVKPNPPPLCPPTPPPPCPFRITVRQNPAPGAWPGSGGYSLSQRLYMDGDHSRS